MKKLKLSVGILAVVFCLGGIAHAAPVTLNFDDLTNPDGGPVPGGYGGLNWMNVYYTPAFPPAESAPNVAFNGYAMPAFVTSQSGDFNFISTYFTSPWEDSITVQVIGLNVDELKFVGIKTLSLTKGNLMQEYSFNFNDVDTLIFSSYNNVEGGIPAFSMDNFTIDSPVVPIPATLLLFGSGILGLFGIRRRLNR